MVLEVWANIRQRIAMATPSLWRQMALGCASFSRINGETHSLWRAVDQDGNVLDILVQSRRNKQAAKRFFRNLRVRLQYVPRVIITDKLKSYGAAKREILPAGWCR
jgi:transposase-like protein